MRSTVVSRLDLVRGLGPKVLLGLLSFDLLLDGKGTNNGGDQQKDLLHDRCSFVELIVHVIVQLIVRHALTSRNTRRGGGPKRT